LDSREPGVTNWPVTTLRVVNDCWLGRHVGYMPVGITGVLVITVVKVNVL